MSDENRAETASLDATAAQAARAEALFREGTVAFEAGDYETALERLQQSHAILPTYRSAAVLGQLELELGQHVNAARHLDESVRKFPRGKDPEGLGRVLQGLAEARRHVATLSVHSPTRGAVLWLDGEKVGALPLDADLFVAPGQHRIEVRAERAEARVKEVYLPAGASEQVTIALDRKADTGTEAAPATGTGEGATETAGILPLAALSLAVVSLGVSVGFELQSQATQDDANAIDLELSRDGASCSGNADSRCQQLQNEQDTADRQDRWAKVSLLTAGVFSVAAVALEAWLRPQPEQARATPSGERSRSLSITPFASETEAGVGIGGGF